MQTQIWVLLDKSSRCLWKYLLKDSDQRTKTRNIAQLGKYNYVKKKKTHNAHGIILLRKAYVWVRDSA